MINKNKKSFKSVFWFALLLLIVLSVIGFFVIKKQNLNDDYDISKSLSTQLDKTQLNIFNKIYNANIKKGLYTYQSIDENNDTREENVFVSGDRRMLSTPNKGKYQLYDGKFLYNVSDEYGKFFKKELKDYRVPPVNHSYLEYGKFFNDSGGGEDTLIDGLAIYEDSDNNYIIKNNRVSYIFDKDLVMSESKGYSNGIYTTKSLIDYDEDFDKYYNECFEKIANFEEVDDVNMISP